MNLLRFLTLALLSAGVFGCGASQPTPIDHNQEVLSQLPAEDREAALAQWNCIVCKELLAREGMPKKSEQADGPIFFCTEDCQTQFEKSPAKFKSALSE